MRVEHDGSLTPLLTGLAFALFYSVLAIPFGRYADRSNRRNLVAWCCLAWSIATALCGLAVGFWTLAAARVAVAIGEREPEFRHVFVNEWSTAWQSRSDAPWAVKRLSIDNGTHAASIGESYRQAMLWLFDADVQAAKQSAETSDH